MAQNSKNIFEMAAYWYMMVRQEVEMKIKEKITEERQMSVCESVSVPIIRGSAQKGKTKRKRKYETSE